MDKKTEQYKVGKTEQSGEKTRKKDPIFVNDLSHVVYLFLCQSSVKLKSFLLLKLRYLLYTIFLICFL